MTWYSEYSGGNSTVNQLTVSGGDEIMYDLLKLLTTHAGTTWSCLSSGDGVANYNASGDLFTHTGSGAYGMGNNNAWFRITDPGARREYLFQRVNITTWICRYSALDKFTGGTPSYNTLPTATDEQGFGNGLFSTGVALFSSTSQTTYHIACNDSPDGNTYPFWYIGRTINTGAVRSSIIIDAVIDDTAPSADDDKCVMLASAQALTDGLLASRTSSILVGWMRMDEADEEFGRFSALYMRDASGTITPDNMGRSPVSNEYLAGNVPLRRGTGTHLGPKGQMANLLYRPVTDYYSSVYYDGTDYYIIADDVLIRGWPSAEPPLI